MADEIAENAVIESVHLGIGGDDLAGKVGIASGIGGEHIVHHLAGEFAHCRQQCQRFEPGAAIDHSDPLGDILGIVADPFDYACNLERGDDFAQVIRPSVRARR